jgi:two-component system cell cycle response regulator
MPTAGPAPGPPYIVSPLGNWLARATRHTQRGRDPDSLLRRAAQQNAWQTCQELSLLEQVAARLRALLSDDTDQALVRARASGEVLVAAMRLGFTVVFAGLVILNLTPQTRVLELGLILGAIVYGCATFALALKVRSWWLPWVTSTIDVTLISVAVLMHAFAGSPASAVNNRTYFDIYFFLMANAALRYDWRLCAYTALLVVTQFVGLSAYVSARWDLGDKFFPYYHALRILTLVATGVSTTVVARWARHLRLMVGTDHLTGLSQRRPFLERIEEELQRTTSTRGTLSVALLDVDEFKKFNDTHGHLAGDRALQLLAMRLRKSVRSSDLVARFGGEEFVIAFPRLDVDRAVRRVNELRAELGAVPIPANGKTHQLTLSAGVGSWPTDGETFEAVLARVDERLYEAKAAGRNRVVGPAAQSLRALEG